MALPYEFDSYRGGSGPQGAAAASGSTAGGGFSGPFLSALLSGNPGFGIDQYAPGLSRRPQFGRMAPAGGMSSPQFGRMATPRGMAAPMSAYPGALQGPAAGGATSGFQGGMAKNRALELANNRQGASLAGGWVDPNNPWAGSSKGWEAIIGRMLGEAGGQGMFGQQGDPRITAMLRQQAIEDAGAQGRQMRLALQSRTDIDPSTYGFQALMSGLQGQDQVSKAMNQAQLQQSLSAQQWYRNMMAQLLQSQMGGQFGVAQAYAGRPPEQGFDWGSLLGGAGQLIGAI